MATIGQFQSKLITKTKRYLIEKEIGRDLMRRIESTGGVLHLEAGNNFFEFINVSPELKTELEDKIADIRKGLSKWQLE